jgi:hypothetical protein
MPKFGIINPRLCCNLRRSSDYKWCTMRTSSQVGTKWNDDDFSKAFPTLHFSTTCREVDYIPRIVQSLKMSPNWRRFLNPVFQLVTNLATNRVYNRNFGSSWSEVKIVSNLNSISRGNLCSWWTEVDRAIDSTQKFCPSWAEVRYGTCGQHDHKLIWLSKLGFNFRPCWAEVTCRDFRTSCPEVETVNFVPSWREVAWNNEGQLVLIYERPE